MSRLASTAIALLVIGTAGARADLIAEFHPPTNLSDALVPGQSVTTPAGGPWNALTFAWIAGDGVTRVPAGDLFLLTGEYLGTPDALSSATPGFLGEASPSGDIYAFAPGVTVLPNTQYFFYSTARPVGGIGYSLGYPGGNLFDANFPSTNFESGAPFNHSFILEGSLGTPVPEPSGIVVLLLALAVVVGRRLGYALAS
jgi:hypothetical protein